MKHTMYMKLVCLKCNRMVSPAEVNGVKKSPAKTPGPKKGDPKSRLVEMGTQTSPGLALRSRGRPKKTSA